MKDLIDIKIGDKDSLGRVISKIFIRSTRIRTIENLKEKGTKTSLEEVKYLIYVTEDNQLQYDVLNEYGRNLIPYTGMLNQILELLQIEPFLHQKYYKVLANMLRSIFEKAAEGEGEEEEFTDFFEKLKQKIERNIFSIARLEYLKRYMVIMFYVGIIVAVCLVLPKLYKPFEVPYVNYLYLGICGTIGGFFSVVSKINQLPIDPFLPFERSRLDVYVRFVIATLSGILIYWFLQSGFIGIVKVAELQFTESNMFLPLSIAVISGFSERIIPAIITTKEKEYFKSINKQTN
jgi:hypothetical protein